MRRRMAVVTLILALASAGCAGGVKHYQREFLADRIMDQAATARERGTERHWLDTREGAAGGALGAGGGCACN